MDLSSISEKFSKWTGSTMKWISKSFRGLLCEKKEGEWELSKGNVSYWIVFGMMCKIWWNHGVQFKMPDLSNLEDAEGVKASLGAMRDVVSQISSASDVPETMLYVWGALLTYATVKATKGGVTNMMAAWRSGAAALEKK